MSHALSKIWIHAIWSTKNRTELIEKHHEQHIYTFIKNQFNECGCYIKNINGMPDHIHCLFLLNTQKSISEVIKQIKGSSAHYINQNNLCYTTFSWQTGYAAYSVSESIVGKVDAYIQHQKTHHALKSFEQEYNSLIKIYHSAHGFNHGS